MPEFYSAGAEPTYYFPQSMTCRQCKTRIRLSHQPGRFLGIAAALGGAAAITGATFSTNALLSFITTPLALWSMAALCGVWTEMTDASATVYSQFQRQGVQCGSCGHINPIRPWSM